MRDLQGVTQNRSIGASGPNRAFVEGEANGRKDPKLTIPK